MPTATAVALITVGFLWNAGSAKAHIIENVFVNASFGPTDQFGNVVTLPPNLYLTGDFTIDIPPNTLGFSTDGTITSFHMALTDLDAHTKYEFSSRTGAATATFVQLESFWFFTFGDSNARIVLVTAGRLQELDPGSLLAVPESFPPGIYPISGNNTFYPGAIPGCPTCTYGPWGQGASVASVDGVSGATYTLKSPGPTGPTSGFLTVTTVPEPTQAGLLLLGTALVFGIRRYRSVL